jgi:hypothetical protein
VREEKFPCASPCGGTTGPSVLRFSDVSRYPGAEFAPIGKKTGVIVGQAVSHMTTTRAAAVQQRIAATAFEAFSALRVESGVLFAVGKLVGQLPIEEQLSTRKW